MVELAETGQMTPEKRAEVLSTIKAQAAAQEDRQAEIDSYYSNLAGKYQADPELIIGSKRSTAKQKSKTNPTKDQPAALSPEEQSELEQLEQMAKEKGW
jgi:hypothetical protein